MTHAGKRVRMLGVLMLPLLAGCSLFGTAGPVRVAIIGTSATIADPDNGAPSNASLILGAAVAQGLVTFGADGTVTAGLAERWTVTDDGLSYIFRIRRASWSDGRTVTTEDIAQILKRRLNARGNLIAQQLTAISDVRAMTEHVIEIRLTRPQSDLLTMLAQPEMGLMRNGRGWGPYRIKRSNGAARLTPIVDPLALELGEAEPPSENESIDVVVRPAAQSVARFKDDAADAVLGGRFQDYTYAASAGINNAIRLDPVSGLFGFLIVRNDGFLALPAHRSAISRALHRSRMLAALGPQGWEPTASIRPPAAATDETLPQIQPDWATREPALRQREARLLAQAWQARTGAAPRLRIALPDGPGARILFAYVRADLAQAGIEAQLVRTNDPADVRLIDEVAPSDDPAWYLYRLSCRMTPQCSREAEPILAAARLESDLSKRNAELIRAETQMVRDGWYIPLAVPLRWSLVSGELPAFRTNIRARHPLNLLRRPTT